MTYHLMTKSGRRFCDPKKGGYITHSLPKCNCKECLDKYNKTKSTT